MLKHKIMTTLNFSTVRNGYGKEIDLLNDTISKIKTFKKKIKSLFFKNNYNFCLHNQISHVYIVGKY